MKVLITGGTKGIGRAIAEKFNQYGHNVTVTGRNLPLDWNKEIGFSKVDFMNKLEFQCFLNDIPNHNYDVLVNNAGINIVSPFETISMADFENIIDFNLKLPFLISQKVIPYMKEKSSGKIINISSIFGSISKEFRASYSSSKFGLIGMTKAMAIELAQFNILCNCVSPGFIDTELTRSILNNEQVQSLINQVPIKRLGTPEEIAHVVYFLASKENTLITGQNIIADGGFTSV